MTTYVSSSILLKALEAIKKLEFNVDGGDGDIRWKFFGGMRIRMCLQRCKNVALCGLIYKVSRNYDTVNINEERLMLC